MRGGVYNPPALSFTPITTVSYTVAAGGAGFPQVDVSSTTGTDTHKIWVISAHSVLGGDVGARPHGAAVGGVTPANKSTTLLCSCDNAGLMDLYRVAAGDNIYDFIGYISS